MLAQILASALDLIATLKASSSLESYVWQRFLVALESSVKRPDPVRYRRRTNNEQIEHTLRYIVPLLLRFGSGANIMVFYALFSESKASDSPVPAQLRRITFIAALMNCVEHCALTFEPWNYGKWNPCAYNHFDQGLGEVHGLVLRIVQAKFFTKEAKKITQYAGWKAQDGSQGIASCDGDDEPPSSFGESSDPIPIL